MMLSGNRLRHTVHTHRAFVHQAAKLAAALLRVARVTAGLAESNGCVLQGLWLTSPAGWLPRTGISSGTLRSAVKYGLPLPSFTTGCVCSVFETSLPRELPIVHEITTVLREWHHLWKERYLVSLCTVCWIYLQLASYSVWTFILTIAFKLFTV